MGFSAEQMYAIEVTERVCSVFSLLGTAFIITTFLTDKAFHRPINRLVFYATWGNIMSNVATLISTAGIRLGINSGLCQTQAFIIQWFMPADALWTFAMALNVYLTFFRKYDAKQLRALEWRYILLCYGIPFIPAFIYVFVKTGSRGRVYGSAFLWCWVSIDWDYLRVATFYGPVWMVIFATFGIYISAGKVVLQWRGQLLKYANNHPMDVEVRNRVQTPVSGILKLTEIYVTSEPAQASNSPLRRTFERNPTQPASKIWSSSLNRLPRRSANIDANKAAVSYCKCALLFFVALLVTWVPSTVNRVVTLAHPEAEIFGLNYTSGLVLPLQGFWNALVYIFTSYKACKALIRRITPTSTKRQRTDPTSLRLKARFTPLDVSGNAGRENKKQGCCSESLQELRINSLNG